MGRYKQRRQNKLGKIITENTQRENLGAWRTVHGDIKYNKLRLSREVFDALVEPKPKIIQDNGDHVIVEQRRKMQQIGNYVGKAEVDR